MAYFNESSLEMAIMELFKTERYIYQNGNTILKDDTEVLLRDDLRQYLNDRYKTAGITDIETERAINQLTANAGVSMYEQNAITLRLMVEGFSVKREDSGLPDLFIEPIDFTGARNIVKIVNQMKMRGRCDRIPDGIVYVNGLPLVVLEFKSAIKENTTIMDAYKQLTIRYRRDIPELFRYNAFVVISDGVNNKYGSLFTLYEYFYAWRKVEADDDTADGIDALDTLVKGLFRKDRLLAVVKDFIYMPDNSSKEEKIICRYPQYFAATKLLASIKSHSRIMLHGDGKGGTYFGSTGCGKSYAMLFLTRMLMRDKAFGNPTILLITDRTDLDAQLSKQFKNAKRFIGDDCVMCIENRAHLGEMLRGRKSGGVFLTTIQKFTEELQLLSDRSNIICISDEAHRTQVNMDEKIRVDENGVKRNYGFARYLHDSLPNATYVGFTGTPIDATLEVFGPIVDAYTMKQSVEDKITNRIVYEGRAAKVLLDNGKLQEIEDYYDKCADDGANEYQIEESKKAVSRMEVIIGDSQRLEAVAKDLVAHYERRVEEGSTVVGKAMIVCMSRKIAFRLYKYISELRPEWITLPADGTDETEGENCGEKMAADYIPEYGASVMPIEKMKMIMTYNKDDDAELYEILDRDRNRTDLDTQFKNPHSNFKIAIVVDMWITGFDVPCLDTMYIDRPLQKHTLVQTISRVNRLYEGKTKGLVVDYFGIRRKMDDALAKYNQGDGFGSSVEEQEQSVVLVKDELDILRKLFYPFDYGTFTSGTPLQQLDCLNKGAEHIMGTQERESSFMGHAKKLKQAYNLCLTSDELNDSDREDIHYFTGVRSIIYKLTKGEAPDASQMNQHVYRMIEEAMHSDGVEEILQMGNRPLNIDLLSDEYMERLNQIELPNTRMKLLERLMKQVILSFQNVNKVKAIDFTERFNELVSQYNERKDDSTIIKEILEEISKKMEDLFHDVKSEKDRASEIGISYEEKAFYDILETVAKKYAFNDKFTRETYKEMAVRIKAMVDDKTKYTDWDSRDDIKAELKMDLILLLKEYGYPPASFDDAYNEIFEQTENFKKYNG